MGKHIDPQVRVADSTQSETDLLKSRRRHTKLSSFHQMGKIWANGFKVCEGKTCGGRSCCEASMTPPRCLARFPARVSVWESHQEPSRGPQSHLFQALFSIRLFGNVSRWRRAVTILEVVEGVLFFFFAAPGEAACSFPWEGLLRAGVKVNAFIASVHWSSKHFTKCNFTCFKRKNPECLRWVICFPTDSDPWIVTGGASVGALWFLSVFSGFKASFKTFKSGLGWLQTLSK